MSNRSWWTRAQAALPGGVNSPVRAFKSVPGDPVFFKSAKGAHFEDEDGREYIDYCQSWGPMILGHADPDVQAAIEEAVREGCSFGAPSRREVLLAEAVLERPQGFQRPGSVSPGTQGVMSAIRPAPGATGRG
nr:aminotransferase class III-fold pyridoxal phosphate-dependent enzyme [bacterium]